MLIAATGMAVCHDTATKNNNKKALRRFAQVWRSALPRGVTACVFSVECVPGLPWQFAALLRLAPFLWPWRVAVCWGAVSTRIWCQKRIGATMGLTPSTNSREGTGSVCLGGRAGVMNNVVRCHTLLAVCIVRRSMSSQQRLLDLVCGGRLWL